MNVQDALAASFDRDVADAFFLAPLPGESAYNHYNRIKYKVDKATLAKVFGPGPEMTEDDLGHGKIKVEHWSRIVRLSDGESCGICVRTAGRKLSDIAKDAREIVRDLEDEYFHRFREDYTDAWEDATWPEDVHWIAVYPVTGGSEGHYVHVDLILRDGTRKLFLLGKTFAGMENAKAMCNRLIEAFNC